MNKELYIVSAFYYSYRSSRKTETVGTLDELSKKFNLGKICRTPDTLQKALNAKAKKTGTIYTGSTYEVTRHY